MAAKLPLRETVGMALNTLRANRLRSLLTMLGIVIGVSAVRVAHKPVVVPALCKGFCPQIVVLVVVVVLEVVVVLLVVEVVVLVVGATTSA